VIPGPDFRFRGPVRGLRTLRATHPALLVAIGGVVVLMLGLFAAVPMMVVGGSSEMFAAGSCPSGQSGTGQSGTGQITTTGASKTAKNSIPSDYLSWFQHVGQQYGVPWVILAGIGKIESNDGQSSLPGVHSGWNYAGAAGPMQIGVTGASGNTWGGAPVHPASEQVNGVATDENRDGIASVYEAPDAIAGAAKYLLRNGVQSNVQGAIFAYNHLESYVQDVLYYANMYTQGGYTVTQVSTDASTACLTSDDQQAPNQTVANVIAYAEAQIGKPYIWGGTGPDGYDCSGLVMIAYRSAGIDIPRTSQDQWSWGPKIQPGSEEPGDLVFFAGSDGTLTDPGHVGLVIGKNQMVEAYATGFNIRISSFGLSTSAPGDNVVVGFTRPWAHAGIVLPGAQTTS
jgi:cell wall-associated NlpC family hydrolase